MTTPKQNLTALAALIHAQHLLDDAKGAQHLADRNLDSQGYTADNIVARDHARDAVNDAARNYGGVYWHVCHDLGIHYPQLDGEVQRLDVADGYAKGAAERRANSEAKV
jgi:hypothetical protein